MSDSGPYLNPAEAARQVGVSAKALRLYESRGLLYPTRTMAGWRAYGGGAMARAREIAALRRLGLSLFQVKRVLDGDAEVLQAALALHQSGLEAQIHGLSETIGLLRDLRARRARGERPTPGEMAGAIDERLAGISFALPWPWGGERFALTRLAAVSFIVGPLGSGKTRLAQKLAEELSEACFAGLDRAPKATPDPVVQIVVDRLLNDGAGDSPALLALAGVLAHSERQIMVIDLIEHGLDAVSQKAVGELLRQRRAGLPPLFVMTRSTAILDLEHLGPDTALLLCPANHSPPMLVPPHAGAAGHEVLASCLASPQVRARTEGTVVSMAQPGSRVRSA